MTTKLLIFAGLAFTGLAFCLGISKLLPWSLEQLVFAYFAILVLAGGMSIGYVLLIILQDKIKAKLKRD